ncbi:hypothetical protein NSE01_18350 [Novosphingobium sediminis]|uniref:Uncharacterized protein n=1 Tax=Novosphingobium sediminis TaxID=707214 RepID=A0A512AK03_9SPHN|nr:hypothetical protein [Novosphingobium sediminis]GEO00003.1 hypothetical protein NSE01_18350 [Novosphingobium sediminis]
MTTLFDLFASIALTLPGFPADGIVFAPIDDAAMQEDIWDAAGLPSGPPLLVNPQAAGPGGTAAGINPLGPDVWDQVRIEQRVIIRVTPRDAGRDAVAPQLLPLTPMQPIMQPMLPQTRPNAVRFRERKTGKCMPAMGIAAVQPITDGRLMFYMRDRRMIAAGLEKACSARDFYLGFYMSKTPDGQLCVGRDQIHSRAGTTCKLKDVREYVQVDGN